MKGKRLIFTLILSVIILTALAITPEYATQPLPQDPDLICGKFRNGMSYFILKNAKPENRAELRLFVNAGSVNEDDDQQGLAHFTEHMAFNGTQSFERTEVVDYLTSIGMGFSNGLNAGTSYEFTYYMLKVPTDNPEQLRTGIQILSEMAHTVAYHPEELEKERGVIIEEWRMGQGAQQRVSNATMSVLFNGSKYAFRNPIGTEEVLRNFTRDQIVRFYEDWYHPANQSVIAVGDFEPEDVLEILEEYFGQIPAKEKPRQMEKIVIPPNVEPQVVIVTDPEFPYNTTQIIWKREMRPNNTVGDYYDELKQELFGNMLSKRLEEFSKKPNPPFSYAIVLSSNILKGLGGTMAVAMTPKGKGEESVRVILREAERVERFGFLPSELERAKQDISRQLDRAVAQKSTRESESVTWGFLEMLMFGNAYMSPEQNQLLGKELLELVTLEELNTQGSTLFTDENLFIALIGPDSSKSSMPSEEQLLSIFADVKAAELEPYADLVIDKPLVSEKPKAGTIKKQITNRKAGIDIWTLSNGVKVYLKKTNFKEDEVLLSAYSPGGYSQNDEAALSAAKLLSEYIDDSGFGEFDAIALQKATSGKVARAGVSLGLNSEGFSASCSPQDLELMFQMLHQYATNPRWDEDDFQSFLQRQESFLENQELDPQSYYFEQLWASAYSNHPFMQSTKLEDLSKASIAQMQNVFQDRFADFSDFSFIIVGNYDEKEIKTLVRTYLGSLPGTKRKEGFKDLGIRPITGISENRFEKGISDRCYATLISSSPYKPNMPSRSALNVMEQIYNEKLRENIRENLSGAYVVQAATSPMRYPSSHLISLAILMCEPSRVDELLDAMIATADSLKQGLFDQRYLNNAKTTLLKAYEEDIKSNRYWLSGIQNGLIQDRAIDAFLEFPKYYEAITMEDIKMAAKEHLNYEENLLRLIMLPEKKQEPGAAKER